MSSEPAKPLELVLRLHRGGQLELVQDTHRFKVAACGRRWGKTVAAAAQLAAAALRHAGGWQALWLAPTHEQAHEAVEVLQGAFAASGMLADWCATRRRLLFASGAAAYFRSAGIPRNLRGRGWDLVVVDEAAYIADDVWHGVLRPALADRQGRGVFLSTPAGARGWFYEMYLQAASGAFDARAWRLPTRKNPHIAAAEIEAMRASLPERVYRQEIEVEFLAGDGVVFASIPAADYEVPRRPAGPVVIGCDLGKHRDYTVALALDAAGRVVDSRRFQHTEYTTQARLLAALAADYAAPIYLDATGVGDAVLDVLRGLGADVVPVRITRDLKRQLMQNLQVAFECGAVTVPECLEVLMSELRAFSATYTPAGAIYSAPRGLHDDCVIALALAAWGQRRAAASSAMFEDIGGSFL